MPPNDSSSDSAAQLSALRADVRRLREEIRTGAVRAKLDAFQHAIEAQGKYPELMVTYGLDLRTARLIAHYAFALGGDPVDTWSRMDDAARYVGRRKKPAVTASILDRVTTGLASGESPVLLVDQARDLTITTASLLKKTTGNVT